MLYVHLGGNMESRNVKVIDEHGIDRNANVICGLNLDGLDYVLYSVERDGDNDNLFASKIVKNIDGTSSMVNIEDSMEKSKINDVVKELVTYAIKNEANKADGSVTLADGKTVTISGVLFNKEQNINVGKTYITTVKKAATKVSGDFYKVEEVKKEESSSAFENAPVEVAVPVVEEPAPVVEESPVNEVVEEPVAPVLPEVEPVLPEVAPVVEPVVETPVEVPTVSETVPETEAPKVEPILPAEPIPAVVPPVVEEPKVEPILPVSNPVPEVPTEHTESVPAVDESKVEPILPVEPVPAVAPPVVEEPKIEPVAEPIKEEPQLLFDGSQEVNLNRALGEVSNEKTISTQEDGVTSLREFGVDTPAEAVPVAASPAESQGKVLTKSKGFANNKFFMAVAIIFFIGACVFLGYEAFHYFQLVK